MSFRDDLKEKYGCNEPIYVDEIQYQGYSRSWIFTELKKLVDSGELSASMSVSIISPRRCLMGIPS